MPLDHHVYHLPKTELFCWLCMYIDIFILISVVCLNKNMYIFRVLGYIKKQQHAIVKKATQHYSIIMYSFHIFRLILR